jgi:hypothetical protein
MTTMKTPAAEKPTPDPRLEAAVEAAEAKARELRDAIMVALRLASELGETLPPEGQLVTFTDPALLESLAALAFLTDGNQTWLSNWVGGHVASVQRAIPNAAGFLGPAVARGMARSAVSCPCGKCDYCKLREKKGAELAERQIRRDFEHAARPASGLVTPDGQPLD